MDQVFRNLCSNALKFTPAGKSVTVRIRKVSTLLPAPLDASSQLVTGAGAAGPGVTAVGDLESGGGGDKGVCASETGRVAVGALVVQVIDEGAGIAPENQAKLFKEIVQFNPGELQAGGGSGLGMMISKGITDMHGGTLSVWSAGEGHGTTFTLKLPLYSVGPGDLIYSNASSPFQSHLQSAAQSALASPCGSSDAGDHQDQDQDQQDNHKDRDPDDGDGGGSGDERVRKGHMTLPLSLPPVPLLTMPVPVLGSSGRMDAKSLLLSQAQAQSRILDLLVVDDSKLNRRMLRRLLTAECGHVCDEAEDGLEAVERVRAKLPLTYDAILMDFVMPNMDGPTATQEIRKMGYRGLILGVTGG
jgi:hypothetical protein